MNETQILETIVTAGTWQAGAAGVVSLGMWIYRWRRALLAIDTKSEVAALLMAVGAGSVPALQAGGDWRVILVTAVVSAMLFAKANSAAVPLPAPPAKDGEAKS